MASHERPHSRFTREKTQAAMYAQHIQARYALVPHSRRVNSLAYISCKSVEETATKQAELIRKEQACEAFLSSGESFELAPPFLQGMKQAIILGRSSDYYHYRIADSDEDFNLVIAGIHDSMLNLFVWETYTNKRYKPRELPIDISAPGFVKFKKTQYGHNILVGALICGDPRAIALKEKEYMHPKTRQRIEREVSELQRKRQRGRPLAFWNEEKRLEVAHRISYSLIEHHRRKKA